jgi:N-acetylglucosamine-6-phosphate deacetylase
MMLLDPRIIKADRVIKSGALLIRNGRIAVVADSRDASKQTAEATLNLSALTLFPGFIDVHIHGAAGIDTMEATSADLLHIGSFLARNGVTAWQPTFVPSSHEQYQQAVSAIDGAIEKQSSTSARVLGVHYEGPFVSPMQCGALHLEYFQTYKDRHQLDSLPALETPGATMMMTFAPEVEGGVELARELSGRGWVLSIGHTLADAGVLDRAFEAGAKHITHFMNAMAPLHHRTPGPVAWGLMRDDVTCDFIADGRHLDPYTLRLLMKLKGAQGLCLISDAIAATGKGDGEYQIWGETITVKNGRTSNAKGSIAGSVITMLDAVRLMRSLGVSDIEVARMASLNPARLLRLDHEIGSIEVGKRADLVALDNEGNVRLTITGGEIAFQAI